MAAQLSRMSEMNSKSNKAVKTRLQQTIKDKEKQKRMKGQSSHHTWKSETFMLLRQQFD